MEFRVYNLISQYGNWKKKEDIELIYERLQDVMWVSDDSTNEAIIDVIVDLVKCDCCGEYETEYFTSLTSLVLDDDGNHGRICDYCRGNG